MTAHRQTVVFDLDGTLVHSAPDILAALEQALHEAKIPFTRPLPESLIGPPVLGMIERLGAPRTAEQESAAVAAFRRIYDPSPMSRSRPYPGGERLLRELSAQGVRVHVATNKPEKPTRVLLGRFFEGLVVDICCVDSLPGPRLTKEQMLQELTRRHGLDPASAAIVGDAASDIRAGQALGWQTIAVTWGYSARSELFDAGPSAIVDDIEALSKMLLRH